MQTENDWKTPFPIKSLINLKEVNMPDDIGGGERKPIEDELIPNERRGYECPEEIQRPNDFNDI